MEKHTEAEADAFQGQGAHLAVALVNCGPDSRHCFQSIEGFVKRGIL